MFTFQPLSDDEADAGRGEFELLPAGEYPFEVLEAEDAVSQKGNEMIKLKINAFGPKYGKHVYDYLLEKMAFKLRHFCETVGIADQYARGKIDTTGLLGRSGRVILAIEEREGYEPRNVVKDYVKPEPAKLDSREPKSSRRYSEEVTTRGQAQRAAAGRTKDDDVPF